MAHPSFYTPVARDSLRRRLRSKALAEYFSIHTRACTRGFDNKSPPRRHLAFVLYNGVVFISRIAIPFDFRVFFRQRPIGSIIGSNSVFGKQKKEMLIRFFPFPGI